MKMNKFNILKTVQLLALIIITIVALIIIFTNQELYSAIASDPGVRMLAIFLWVVLGISFAFMYYDFYSYTGLKRENTELDNAIYSDALTGIANRYSVDVYLSQFQGKPLPKDLGCITLEIVNLSEINAEAGHTGGDEAIRIFSEILQNAAGGICFIGRNGGNKFLAIFRECTTKKMDVFLQTIHERVALHNRQAREHSKADTSGAVQSGGIVLRYRTGSAFEPEDKKEIITELVALSDHRAWKAETLPADDETSEQNTQTGSGTNKPDTVRQDQLQEDC